MMRRGRLFVFPLVFLLLGSVAHGQFEVGSIVGAVTDPNGSRVPGARIEAVQTATNSSRITTTSDSGEYAIVGLIPGTYTVTITKEGFAKQTRTVNVAVSARVDSSFTLGIESATSSVTVDASANAALETGSSELGNVRSQDQVQGLPLNSRNFTQLVYLAPGVNNKGNSANSVSQGYTNGRGTNGAVINGNPPEDTVYLLDGIQSMDNDADDLILFPNVDSIAEFKVQTSAAPAAFGGSPAIINVSFRSGTNQLHGTVYEFLRNHMFDAKNYFDSHTAPIPKFVYNQFGANLSGPLVIPHILNGRNKLFFFLDYEGKRQNQAQTYTSTVPTAAFRTGDFSSLLQTNTQRSKPIQLVDPVTRSPLVNNYLNPALHPFNATSLKLLSLYPLPNLPGDAANYLFNGPVVNVIHLGDVRVDYHSDKTTIFGRFSKEDPYTSTPGYLPNPAIGAGPSRPGITEIPAWQAVLGYSRAFDENKFYEARLGYSRLTETITDAGVPFGDLAEQYGIPNANASGAGLAPSTFQAASDWVTAREAYKK